MKPVVSAFVDAVGVCEAGSTPLWGQQAIYVLVIDSCNDMQVPTASPLVISHGGFSVLVLIL